MPESLRQIIIPAADGSRNVLSLLTIEDLREPLAKLSAIAEFYDILMSGGPKALAEHLLFYAVSQPAGDYSVLLEIAEHLSPGILAGALDKEGGVTARQVADHFPDVVAIVSPADACFVERSVGGYTAGGVYFASGGLLLKSRMTRGVSYPIPVPRCVDAVHYWNFAICPKLYIAEVEHTSLDKDAIPYLPPKSISGLTNLRSCLYLKLIDSSGRSRLEQVAGYGCGIEDRPLSSSAFADAFRDWATSGFPSNEVDLISLPANWETGGLRIDSLYAGLRAVMYFPFLSLNGCEGARVFQRNPDRPPLVTGASRRCFVAGIGSYGAGSSPQTDLSGLVGWYLTDMELSMRNTASKAAVSGWRILLSKDCYSRLSSTLLASLTAKGFTVVNAG